MLLLGLAVAVMCPAADSQDRGNKTAELALVQVNITTETLGNPESVMIAGKIVRDYTPRIIELFPSTGLVIDDKGHVLTFLGYRWVNIHGRNPRIEIIDSGGRKYPGKLIGIDQNMRIAIVLSEVKGLKKTPLCESCEIKAGATVVMPVSDGSKTLQFESAQILSIGTSGNASGVGEWALKISRPLSMVGAPLLNAQNQVVGIVADQETLAAVPGPEAAVNIFRISQILNSATKIIKAGGDILTGWLGVMVDAEAESGSGVRISGITKDGPADRAGLLAGDVMLKWNGVPVRDSRRWIQIVQDTPIGSKAIIEILRQGKPVTVTALIQARKPVSPSERLVIDVPGVTGPQIPTRDMALMFSLGIDAVPLNAQLAATLQVPVQIGLLVASVKPQAIFDRAGLQTGDIILSVDGINIATPQAMYDHINSRGWGSRLELQLLRKGSDGKGSELNITVQLPRFPGVPVKK
jgi:serine protease Do